MSRRGVIGILIALFGILLAIFGIFVLSRIVQRSLTPVAVATQEQTVTEQVVVARRDLALGSVLNAEDLELVEVPVELALSSALTNPEAAVGRLIKVPLVAGELVMAHHLADPTNIQHDLAFVLGEDQVLMAFPADDLLSSLSLLQRGDLVDILVSIEEPVPAEDIGLLTTAEEGQTEDRLFTFDALQRVEISAMVVDIVANQRGGTTNPVEEAVAQGTPQPTPVPDRSEVRTQAVLLALAPQDALVLKHLKDAGAVVDIVVRNPTSNQIFELDPVMPEYLIDRYQLEIKR